MKLVIPAQGPAFGQSSPKVAATANASTETMSPLHRDKDHPAAVHATRTSRVCHDVSKTCCQIDLAEWYTGGSA
eukprot:3455441-Rhodomonas_salina.2